MNEGIRLAREADFEGAEQAFRDALEGSSLERSGLVRLYSERAIVRHALGDGEGMERDLRRLAALEPDHALGPMAPPPVRERFAEIRDAATGPLALDARATPVADGVRISTHVEGDPGGMVRSVALYVAVGEEALERVLGDSHVISGTSGREVHYYAEALGVGGAVVARAGTASDPLHFEPPSYPSEAEDGNGDELLLEDDGHLRRRRWLIAASASAAVASIVVAVVLTVDGGDESTTSFEAPRVLRWGRR